MRAWSFSSFDLDALTLTELPDPDPAPGQVVVAPQAASLNYRDLMMIRGQYNPRQPLPLVPCSDAAGVVRAVGEGVSLEVGDRVSPCFSQAWAHGPLTDEARRATLGGPLPGVLSERVCVSADAVVPIPVGVDMVHAATVPCAAVTAINALAGVGPGSRVLTLGTGGVSLFVLQFAKQLGAEVAITSSSDAKLARARQLGADHTVNYASDADWGRSVAKWGPVDLTVDLGGTTLEQSLLATRTGGEVASVGVLGGATINLPLTRLFMRGITLRGVFVGSRADHLVAMEQLSTLEPVVDQVFAFEDVPVAFERLAQGCHFGKICISFAG